MVDNTRRKAEYRVQPRLHGLAAIDIEGEIVITPRTRDDHDPAREVSEQLADRLALTIDTAIEAWKEGLEDREDLDVFFDE